MTFADSNLAPLFLAAREEGVLNLFNSPHDPAKLSVIDSSAKVDISGTGAEFTVSNREGSGFLQVDFLDLSGGATDYFWNFGDGNTSNEANPSHRYDLPGVYTVSLTVSGSGSSDILEKSAYIRVNP